MAGSLHWMCLMAVLLLTRSHSHLHIVSLTNTSEIRSIFYSGDPWVVLCQTDGSASRIDPVTLETRVSDARDFVVKSGEVPTIRAGVLDCTHPLPSKKVYVTSSGKRVTKNAIQKFRLDDRLSPLGFTVANGELPQQIAPQHFKSSLKLASHAAASTKIEVPIVDTSDNLSKLCLRRSSCVVAVANNTWSKPQLRLLRRMKEENRATAFVRVNSTTHLLALDPPIPPLTLPASEAKVAPRVLFFSRAPPKPSAEEGTAANTDTNKNKKKNDADKSEGKDKKDKGKKKKAKDTKGKEKDSKKKKTEEKTKEVAEKEPLQVRYKAHRGAFSTDGLRGFLEGVTDRSSLPTIVAPELSRRTKKKKKSKKSTTPTSKPSSKSKTSAPSTKANTRKKKRKLTKEELAEKKRKEVERAERERQRRVEMEEEIAASMIGTEDDEEEELDLVVDTGVADADVGRAKWSPSDEEGDEEDVIVDLDDDGDDDDDDEDDSVVELDDDYEE